MANYNALRFDNNNILSNADSFYRSQKVYKVFENNNMVLKVNNIYRSRKIGKVFTNKGSSLTFDYFPNMYYATS